MPRPPKRLVAPDRSTRERCPLIGPVIPQRILSRTSDRVPTEVWVDVPYPRIVVVKIAAVDEVLGSGKLNAREFREGTRQVTLKTIESVGEKMVKTIDIIVLGVEYTDAEIGAQTIIKIVQLDIRLVDSIYQIGQ